MQSSVDFPAPKPLFNLRSEIWITAIIPAVSLELHQFFLTYTTINGAFVSYFIKWNLYKCAGSLMHYLSLVLKMHKVIAWFSLFNWPIQWWS